MKKFLTALLVLALASCSKPPEPQTPIARLVSAEAAHATALRVKETLRTDHPEWLVNSTDILHLFAQAGVTDFLHATSSHDAYQLVPERLVVGDCCVALRKALFDANVLDWYARGEFDCGDYALAGEFSARAWHRNWVDRIPGSGIAAGVLVYQPDASPDKRHAINVFVTTNRKLVFIEPQLQVPVRLSRPELASVSSLAF